MKDSFHYCKTFVSLMSTLIHPNIFIFRGPSNSLAGEDSFKPHFWSVISPSHRKFSKRHSIVSFIQLYPRFIPACCKIVEIIFYLLFDVSSKSTWNGRTLHSTPKKTLSPSFSLLSCSINATHDSPNDAVLMLEQEGYPLVSLRAGLLLMNTVIRKKSSEPLRFMACPAISRVSFQLRISNCFRPQTFRYWEYAPVIGHWWCWEDQLFQGCGRSSIADRT